MPINLQSNSGQALWLAIANLISFSFGIISAAILSRLLTVDEYGSYRQVLYVYSTLLVVFTLGLPRAYSYFLARIPLSEGRAAVRIINQLFVIIGSVFSITLFIGAPLVANILKNPSLTELLRWFSPTPLLLLPILGIESILTTYKKASFATLYVILSRTFTLVCVIVPVLLFSRTAKSAIIGFTIASFLCLMAGIVIERKPFVNVTPQPTNLKWRELIVYAWPMLIASLWGVLYQSCPQFFISRWWGSTTFAEFSNGFIELPFASMVIGAVSTVLLPAFSREALSKDGHGKQEILRLWKSSFAKSAMIIYPLAIFACVYAKPIMQVLYGDKYIDSAIYFQIILVINLARVIPFTPIMMALNRLKMYSKATMISALISVGLDLIYVHYFNQAWGIAVIQCTAFIILIYLLLNDISSCIKVSIKELLPVKLMAKLLIASLSVTLLSNFIILAVHIDEAITEIIVGVIICVTLFFPFVKFFQVDYRNLFIGFIEKK